MRQKIVKIGSSIGIVISKPVAEERGFRLGGEVEVNPEANSNDIRISPVGPKEKSVIDPAVLKWTEEFIIKNRELLLRLKNK